MLLGVVLLLGSAFAAMAALPPTGAREAAPSAAPALSELHRLLPTLPPPVAMMSILHDALGALSLAAARIPPPLTLALVGVLVTALGGRALIRRGAIAVLCEWLRRLPRPRWHAIRATLGGLRRRAARTAARRKATRAPVAVAPLVVDLPAPLVAAGAIDRPSIAAQPSIAPPPAPPQTTAEAVGAQAPPAVEELAQSIAALLAQEWRALELRGAVVALDAELRAGGGRARVTVDPDPADERALAELAQRLAARDGWGARWRGGALELRVPASAAAPEVGPPLFTLLRHGRGRATRSAPLAWPCGAAAQRAQHLGIYGGAARELLQTGLAGLLFSHAPGQLALAVIDDGLPSPLYTTVPHAAPLPGGPRAAVAALDRALRQGWAREDVRHLVLAVIDPDEALLGDLAGLLRHARERPEAPLSILIAQTRLLASGRELYAVLPACITAGGRGDITLLPDQAGWPARGAARFVASGRRTIGAPAVTGEAELRAALATLGVSPLSGLPPTLWDAPAPRSPAVQRRADIAPDGLCGPDPLALRLALALSGQEPRPAPDIPAEAPDPPSPWPPGPGGLGPAEVAALIAGALSDPAIAGATPPGLTKGRLAALLEPAARPHAAAILAWLDAAGALEDPRHESLRWREPRALRDTDPAAVAARLRAHAADR